MILLSIFQLSVGFAVLSGGGQYLVEGATRIALIVRISTAVIGLTVVALGTSMPELAVSLGAAARGDTDIAYANVVGSNIFNVAIILSITALLRPVPVTQQTIKLEYPFMVFACWIMLLLSRDGLVDRLEGAFFLVALVGFIVYMVRISRADIVPEERAQYEREIAELAGNKTASSRPQWLKSVLLVIVGIAGLALGADLMVRGATTIATALGVTHRVIGLTVIAMGTSLPELATSIVAARRGDQAIALGNVVGSNIFNVLAILGVTSFIFPVPVNPDAIRVDNWVMLGFVVVLFPVMVIGKKVTRRDAIGMLIGFTVYMVFLFSSL